MEKCAGGDLLAYLDERDFSITEERAKDLAHQLVTALCYLHSHGIAHRDLKPENILMTDGSDKADLKISDFGLSKVITPSCPGEPSTVGTLCYAAPEIFLGTPCGVEVDFWSLGVIIYMLLCGNLPFDSLADKEVIKLTVTAEPDFSFEAWQNISDQAKDVCRGLLQKDRAERFDLETISSMPWFSEKKQLQNFCKIPFAKSGASGNSKAA